MLITVKRLEKTEKSQYFLEMPVNKIAYYMCIIIMRSDQKIHSAVKQKLFMLVQKDVKSFMSK